MLKNFLKPGYKKIVIFFIILLFFPFPIFPDGHGLELIPLVIPILFFTVIFNLVFNTSFLGVSGLFESFKIFDILLLYFIVCPVIAYLLACFISVIYNVLAGKIEEEKDPSKQIDTTIHARGTSSWFAYIFIIFFLLFLLVWFSPFFFDGKKGDSIEQVKKNILSDNDSINTQEVTDTENLDFPKDDLTDDQRGVGADTINSSDQILTDTLEKDDKDETSPSISIRSVSDGYWSDRRTWYNGRVPNKKDIVQIDHVVDTDGIDPIIAGLIVSPGAILQNARYINVILTVTDVFKNDGLIRQNPGHGWLLLKTPNDTLNYGAPEDILSRYGLKKEESKKEE